MSTWDYHQLREGAITEALKDSILDLDQRIKQAKGLNTDLSGAFLSLVLISNQNETLYTLEVGRNVTLLYQIPKSRNFCSTSQLEIKQLHNQKTYANNFTATMGYYKGVKATSKPSNIILHNTLSIDVSIQRLDIINNNFALILCSEGVYRALDSDTLLTTVKLCKDFKKLGETLFH